METTVQVPAKEANTEKKQARKNEEDIGLGERKGKKIGHQPDHKSQNLPKTVKDIKACRPQLKVEGHQSNTSEHRKTFKTRMQSVKGIEQLKNNQQKH